MRLVIQVVGAVLLLAACSSTVFNPNAPTSSQDSLNTIYWHNPEAEIEPCGCSLRPRGGIGRVQHVISNIQKEAGHAAVLVSGSLFAPSIPRSLTYSQALAYLKPTAVSLSRSDLALGKSEIDKLVVSLPVVMTNTFVKNKPNFAFKPFLPIESNGKKGLILGFTNSSDKALADYDVRELIKMRGYLDSLVKKEKPAFLFVLLNGDLFNILEETSRLNIPTVIFGGPASNKSNTTQFGNGIVQFITDDRGKDLVHTSFEFPESSKNFYSDKLYNKTAIERDRQMDTLLNIENRLSVATGSSKKFLEADKKQLQSELKVSSLVNSKRDEHSIVVNYNVIELDGTYENEVPAELNNILKQFKENLRKSAQEELEESSSK